MANVQEVKNLYISDWLEEIISNPSEIFKFEKLCSSNNEKVEFMNHLLNKYPLEQFSSRVGKNNATARDAREAGNVHYKVKNWKSASECYAKSIMFAEKDSLELAMALGNRAACSIQEGFIADALVDVSRALAIPNIEDSYKDKLMFRKNVCMSRIGETKKVPSRGTFPEIKSKSKYFENASSKIEPKKNDKLGRFLVATADIKTGEVLMIEKPFSSIPREKGVGTICSCCFFPSRVLIECPGCTVVMYCSHECLNDDKKVHQFECPILEHLELLELNENLLLAIRMLIVACLGGAPINDLTDEEPVDVMYRSSDIRRVFNLRKIEITSQRLMKVGFAAAICVLALRKFTKFFEEFSVTEPEARGFFFKCLHTLLSNTNHIGGTYDSSESVGCGVYPTLSHFKHSCDSNAVGHFFGDVGIIRACKPIRKGKKILMDHGYFYWKIGKEDRQSAMMRWYGFKCTCEACVGNWPTLLNLPKPLPALLPCDAVFKELEKKYFANNNREYKTSERFYQKIERLIKDLFLRKLEKEDLDFLCFYLDYLDDLKIPHPWLAYLSCQLKISDALDYFPTYIRC